MSFVLNIAHNFSLLLEGWTLILSLLVLGGAIVLLFLITKGKRKPAVFLATALALSIALLIPNALLASEATWQAMYAAYVAAPPARSAGCARDIREYWSRNARGVLMRDWYFVAHRWGVCHELWNESGCVSATGPRESMGIARELLSNVAESGR